MEERLCWLVFCTSASHFAGAIAIYIIIIMLNLILYTHYYASIHEKHGVTNHDQCLILKGSKQDI